MQGGTCDSSTQVGTSESSNSNGGLYIHNENYNSWDLYIIRVTLGDITKTISLTHEMFRESPEHSKTPNKTPNQDMRIFKILGLYTINQPIFTFSRISLVYLRFNQSVTTIANPPIQHFTSELPTCFRSLPEIEPDSPYYIRVVYLE